jgi:hypothetical protein
MILILSEKNDRSTDKVEVWLNYFKAAYVRVNKEEETDMLESISLGNKNNNIVFNIHNTSYCLNDFKVVWNRRGHVRINFPVFPEDLKKQEPKLVNVMVKNLSEEYKTLQHFIYYKIKQLPSINDPRVYNINKLMVLDQAIKSGFSIPNTSISRNPYGMANENTEYVTKNIQDGFAFISDTCRTGQKTFGFKHLDKFDDLGYSLIQEKIKAKYEVRTFVWLNTCFSVAIFSNKGTEPDHRDHILQNETRIAPIILDEKITKKIQHLLQSLKLESGSIDMMVSAEDEYYFLEVNPVGQFDYVSVLGDYPIEKTIAQTLISY